MTKQEAARRLNSGKKVFASWYESSRHEQVSAEIKSIIDRGYGYFHVELATGGLSIDSLTADRVVFSNKPL